MGAVISLLVHYPTSCVVRPTMHGGRVAPRADAVTADCQWFQNTAGTACGVGGSFVVKRIVAKASDTRRRVHTQAMSWGLSAEAAGELGDVAVGKKAKVSRKVKASIGAQFGFRSEVTDEYVLQLVYVVSDSSAATSFYAYKNYEAG